VTAPAGTPVRKSGSVYALGMRVTRLTPLSGAPLIGVDNCYVTDNLVKLDFTVEYREGTEVERLNGQGRACLYHATPKTVKRLVVDSLELCYPDPELEELLGGGDVLLDDEGRPIGHAAPEVGADPVPNGVGIELWSSAITDDGVDDELPYIWWTLPREYLSPTGVSVSADPMAAAFEGHGNQNPGWGNGPFNDWRWESGRVVQRVRQETMPNLSANGFVTVPPAV
jgi:hypothetical protein